MNLLEKILNNNYRFLKIFILLAILLCLGFYSFLFGPKTELSFPECLSDPERYDGKKLVIGGRVKRITKQGPEIYQWNRYVPLKGIKEPPKIGETISGIGVFKKEGLVELRDYHIHRGRGLKTRVSAMALIVVPILFFRNYRFDFKNLVLFRKEAS